MGEKIKLELYNPHQNLLPAFDCADWKTWFPNEALAPCFSKQKNFFGTLLKIKSVAKKRNFGKWICDIPEVKEGDAYKISVEYISEQVELERMNISAMITWIGTEAKILVREYIDCRYNIEDGWIRLCKDIEAPVGACSARFELVFSESGNGLVLWRNPVFKQTGPIVPRKVKIATTYIKPRYDLKKNLQAMLDIVDEAAKKGPDIILLTESAYDRGVHVPLEEKCVKIPSDITERISEKARLYKSYIIVNLNENDEGYFYNTAVLIGRGGEILGKYRKTHLPLTEREQGFSPGDGFPVFETDFGKIAMLICWDQRFVEAARILRLKGAEIIFHPTIGYFPSQSQIQSVDNGLYFVVSGGDGPVPSRIINPMGEIIAEVKSESEGVAVAEIDLSKRFYNKGMSVGPAMGEARGMLLTERRTDIYNDLII